MRFRVINHRNFQLFSRPKHPFSRATQENAAKKSFNPLHLGKKAKYVIVSIIVVVMLVSIFAVLQNENPNASPTNIVPQSSDNPTTGPSSTNNQRTPGETNTPGSTPYYTNNPGPYFPIETPTEDPWGHLPGVLETATAMNNSVWTEVAREAWAYFQPGVGVDSTMGLPGAVSGYPYFTDWDLGVYTQAVIDAQKIKLPDSPGWTADKRFNLILTFLETRPLNETTNYPFWFYQAGDGKNYEPQSNLAKVKVDAVDIGRLFVALNNLKTFNPSYSTRINNIVLHGRSDYTAIALEVKNEANSNSIYSYYVCSGYAAFWPEVAYVPGVILDNILKTPQVTVNEHGNLTLPNAPISCEPLLHAIFELNISNATQKANLLNFTKQVYLVHEERSNLELDPRYVAFSEGNSGSQTFIYEWVVLPGVGSWKVTTIDYKPYDIKPIIYTKVALGFLALYNSSYAKAMSVYLERSMPLATDATKNGWCDGADWTMARADRTIIDSVGSNTNGMILEAARYFIQNHP